MPDFTSRDRITVAVLALITIAAAIIIWPYYQQNLAAKSASMVVFTGVFVFALSYLFSHLRLRLWSLYAISAIEISVLFHLQAIASDEADIKLIQMMLIGFSLCAFAIAQLWNKALKNQD